MTTVATPRLKNLVERIERVEGDQRGLAADKKDIYTEVKSAGFDAKIVRRIVRERRIGWNQVAEADALRDTYRNALETSESSEHDV